MASIIKVDQIQSDSGTVNVSSNLASHNIVSGTTNHIRMFDTRSSTGVGTMIGANQDGNTYYDSNYNNTATAGGHNWRSAGTDIMNLYSSGRLNLPYGQITFPASQNASSDGNTLDDYEEGTFSPTFYTDGDSSTITFTNNTRYIKIGRFVWFCLYSLRNQVSVTSGNLYMTGLPYAPATAQPTINLGGLSWFDNGGVTTDYTAITYVEASGGGRVFFTQLTNPAQQQSNRYVQAQNITNSRPIYITGSYMAND